MTDQPADFDTRNETMGAEIKRARQSRGMGVKKHAQAAGIDPDRLKQFESGEDAPSLPELEIIAFHLDLPVEHFLENLPLETQEVVMGHFDIQRYFDLRNRVIGARIRLARQNKGLSLEDLASVVGLDSNTLQEYEFGQTPIPLPDLESISTHLDHSMRDFYDSQGPVGSWSTQQRALKDFVNLPSELQQFVSRPVNRPYLELAQRLSEMSVDRLRAVAEGLLEITY